MFDSVTTTVRVSNDRQDSRWSKGSVLIVEDHRDSREILSLLFDSLGYTVLEARDGYQALRLLADTPVDLIVTDLGLPGVDGFELIKRVRAEKRNQQDLKIALVTAYDLGSCEEAARYAGCDLVLGKPIGLDKFDQLAGLLPQRAEPRPTFGRSASFVGN
jgi:CheY-like chemotaxis protein